MSFTLIPSNSSVVVFTDIEKMRKHMEEKGSTHIPSKSIAGKSGLTVTTGTSTILVWVRVQEKDSDGRLLQKTIAHESVHVVRAIQKRLGMKQPLDEEVDAYMIGQVYHEICIQLLGLGCNPSRPTIKLQDKEIKEESSEKGAVTSESKTTEPIVVEEHHHQEWVHISQAPKDGTVIWVRRKHLDQLVEGWACWDKPKLVDGAISKFPKMWLDETRTVKFPQPTEYAPWKLYQGNNK
jgi:hypothetical protein